jgi:TRAP-type mannitol/chloroaromatic compound transport system substrate-binding protein
MSIFARLFSWFAEDVIVKTLANSRRFQQLALKIDNTIQTNSKVINENVIKTGKEAMSQNLNKVKASTADIKKFGQSFADELKKEMAQAKQQSKQ